MPEAPQPRQRTTTRTGSLSLPVIRANKFARPFTGGNPLPVSVGELRPGDRVVYRLRGLLLEEVVASAPEHLHPPAGYVAVRYVGRHLDQHYAMTTCLAVAR